MGGWLVAARLVLAAIASLAVAVPAGATPPGSNGLIGWQRETTTSSRASARPRSPRTFSEEVWPAGAYFGVRRPRAFDPDWSPDRTRFVYHSDIAAISASGGQIRKILASRA